MGLLYLFIALWIRSIWGNCQGYDDWQQTGSRELLHWSVIFRVAVVVAIGLGLRRHPAIGHRRSLRKHIPPRAGWPRDQA